jgi:hypothetical protein
MAVFGDPRSTVASLRMTDTMIMIRMPATCRRTIAPLHDRVNSHVIGGTLLGAGPGAALGAAVDTGIGAACPECVGLSPAVMHGIAEIFTTAT